MSCNDTICIYGTATTSSCSMINGYVLFTSPPTSYLNNMYFSIVNNYQNNYGNIIPSFIKILGNYTSGSEIDNTFDNVGVFFDGAFVMDRYVTPDVSQISQDLA